MTFYVFWDVAHVFSNTGLIGATWTCCPSTLRRCALVVVPVNVEVPVVGTSKFHVALVAGERFRSVVSSQMSREFVWPGKRFIAVLTLADERPLACTSQQQPSLIIKICHKHPHRFNAVLSDILSEEFEALVWKHATMDISDMTRNSLSVCEKNALCYGTVS